MTKKMNVGEDGRLYFKYALGAEYTFTPEVGAPFVYRIAKCHASDFGAEEYRIEINGCLKPTIYPAEDIDFLRSLMTNEQTADGERQELPLQFDEVEIYYRAKREQLNAANKAENAKLKGTDYNKYLQDKGAAVKRLRMAQAEHDDEEVAALERAIKDIEAKFEALFAEKGVNVKILTKACECALCSDTGFISSKYICDCARRREDVIKAYNAEIRLSELK